MKEEAETGRQAPAMEQLRNGERGNQSRREEIFQEVSEVE